MVVLKTVDLVIIFGFFAFALAIGLWASRKSGQDSSEYFLSGRTMPWWLLGFSMVATTFSTDTPNLVTDIVRTNGVAGNWCWWAFLLTGMLTVFVYAKLWRRINVLTDLEFYEIRYSGSMAAFLRGFRAVYLGVFFNIAIMATVSLAAIKIGGIMLGLSPVHCVVWASLVTVIFSSMGGFRGVLLTDFVLFIIAMIGAIGAAVVSLSHEKVGGLSGLMAHFNATPELTSKLAIFPSLDNWDFFATFLLIPILVQWWSVWYPGAEPGGGGYLVQRMLAAKNEKHATAATLFFNVAHYALRPWPWIIVALASMIVFPDLASIRSAFPNADPGIIKNDAAYSAMLTFLPAGLLGLVLTSLIAAYMSTISTHLNWGSSYIVNDIWKRFVKKDATEKELVWIGRMSTVILMVVAGVIALFLKNALQAFEILLQIGAGTGLLFILRWFWWRINAVSELTAMVVSFIVAVIMKMTPLGAKFTSSQQLIYGVAITTVCWVLATLLSKPDSKETLRNFCKVANPGGPGWKMVYEEAEQEGTPIKSEYKAESISLGIICMILGCLTVYSALFSTGYFLYGRTGLAVLMAVISVAGMTALLKLWDRVNA
ncbi:sodium:solute symporter family protein [Candidatus Riflebacteria bacterium]